MSEEKLNEKPIENEATKKGSSYKKILLLLLFISLIVAVAAYVIDPTNEIVSSDIVGGVDPELLQAILAVAIIVFAISFNLFILRAICIGIGKLFKRSGKGNQGANGGTAESGSENLSTFEKIRKWNDEGKAKYDPGLLVCPECGGEDLQIVTEASTKGNNFGAGKACCGYILLGPLGLLCGACGTGKQLKSDTFFICKTCGNRFKKLTRGDLAFKSKAWREKYAGFQAAARKRHGLEPGATSQPTLDAHVVEKETPSQNP